MAFNKELGFGPDHCFYHVLPMSYMAGFLNNLLCPFLAGSRVIVGPAFDARLGLKFWEAASKHGVNVMWLVPTILTALLAIDRNPAGREYCRNQVKTICVGTAPLPQKVKKEFEGQYGVELFESYGLSELLFVTCNSRRFPRLAGSVGRALPGVEIRVVNGQDEVVEPEIEGEIMVKTPFLMAGYLNYDSLLPDPVEPSGSKES